jgi:PIN domain nuclease of toxin-antitoxin system
MRLLLDTHTFLWFIEDNPLLSSDAKNLLESDVDLLISTASLWEIAIKNNIGKLGLAQPFEIFIPSQLAKNAIELLPIEISHLAVITRLPMHHRDPFDRLLIAQAITEQVPIVSVDNKFDTYGIKRLW